jgi:hypothetical protein
VTACEARGRCSNSGRYMSVSGCFIEGMERTLVKFLHNAVILTVTVCTIYKQTLCRSVIAAGYSQNIQEWRFFYAKYNYSLQQDSFYGGCDKPLLQETCLPEENRTHFLPSYLFARHPSKSPLLYSPPPVI